MEPVTIRLNETAGLSRHGEPVSIGVPFSQGELEDTSQLKLVNEQGRGVTACFTRLSSWPDGSIRWVQVETLTRVAAGQRTNLILTRTGYPANWETQTPQVETLECGTRIQTPSVCLLLHTCQPAWESIKGNQSITTRARLTAKTGDQCKAVVDSDWQIHTRGALYVQATLEGDWQQPERRSLCRFRCTLTIYNDTPLVTVDFKIHNPNRARHRGGLWDLGDEGSVYLRSLTLITQLDGDRATLQPDMVNHPEYRFDGEALSLYQDSSGGDHWNSLNHVDREGKLTTHFQGYRLNASTQRLCIGKRSNPGLTVTGRGTLTTAMPGFWQNFPSSLEYTHNQKEGNATVVAGLFPEQPDNRCHELQGGEQKSLRTVFSYHDAQTDLSWVYQPMIPALDASVYQAGQAFPWFTAHNSKDALDSILQEGLEGPDNFFAKREAIDEYGWRHFGDLFADHETLYQPPGTPPLVSHYNNQYDPIHGFARQFALTGDPRWFELMDDLARHVVDIDIYHTELDRAEYNHGLFWHTDHYLPAHTATHRTFSRHNDTSSTPGQTGGGPAEEHCYLTGLLYHHLLTGADDSRQAVLDLASWITNLHEGSGSFLEQLLRIKRRDVPQIRSLLARRKPTPHVYPFNRGTGNYLNTLLDAHVLEPQSGWLARAERVLFSTIHPQDPIRDRNLLDAENSWSYLVLLAAVSRFLGVKEEQGAFDDAYQYALASFRHYARWMLANEQTFLSRPEELEFANDTWVAQDMRKAMLLFQAAHWDTELANQYRARAAEFYNYVTTTLSKSPERAMTRIQVILLQNYGPHQTMAAIGPEAPATGAGMPPAPNPVSLTWTALLARMGCRLVKGLTGFRLQKEQKWLATRVER